MLKVRKMDTKDEGIIWEALQLLTKAEYAIGRVATKEKEEQAYRKFEKAREKIKEAEVLITPLLTLYFFSFISSF